MGLHIKFIAVTRHCLFICKYSSTFVFIRERIIKMLCICLTKLRHHSNFLAISCVFKDNIILLQLQWGFYNWFHNTGEKTHLALFWKMKLFNQLKQKTNKDPGLESALEQRWVSAPCARSQRVRHASCHFLQNLLKQTKI